MVEEEEEVEEEAVLLALPPSAPCPGRMGSGAGTRAGFGNGGRGSSVSKEETQLLAFRDGAACARERGTGVADSALELALLTQSGSGAPGIRR